MPVKYLLDTSAWILLVDAPQRLPRTVLRVAQDLGNAPLGLSAISVWEVARKTALGKLQLSLPVRQWLQQATQPAGIEILPLTPEVALESAFLPGDFHRDPADQIIVATARLSNAVLVTGDRPVRDYPYVRTLWGTR